MSLVVSEYCKCHLDLALGTTGQWTSDYLIYAVNLGIVFSRIRWHDIASQIVYSFQMKDFCWILDNVHGYVVQI